MDEHLTCINIFGGCKKKEKQTLAIWIMELETAMINRYPVTGHWCPSLPAIPHLCLVDWTEVLPRAKPSSVLSVAKEKPQWSRWTRFSADDETILSNFQVPQEDEAIFWLHVYTGVWVLLSTGNIVGWEEEYFENHLNPTDVSTAWKLGKLPVNLQTGPVVDSPPPPNRVPGTRGCTFTEISCPGKIYASDSGRHRSMFFHCCGTKHQLIFLSRILWWVWTSDQDFWSDLWCLELEYRVC